MCLLVWCLEGREGEATQSLHPELKRTGVGTQTLCTVLKHTEVRNSSLHPVLVCIGEENLSLLFVPRMNQGQMGADMTPLEAVLEGFRTKVAGQLTAVVLLRWGISADADSHAACDKMLEVTTSFASPTMLMYVLPLKKHRHHNGLVPSRHQPGDPRGGNGHCHHRFYHQPADEAAAHRC